MLNGGGQVNMPQHTLQSSAGTHRAYPAEIRIIEQPAPKALRFRYECEGRSAGSIPGASSTPENKKFPEIQVVGCDPGILRNAVVVVSCVTKDPPYLAHPHNLVGRDNCKEGVCTVPIPLDTMRVEFQNLGIQCVKKRDVEKSLTIREKLKVDPFKRGFSHKNQPTSIDLNAVRLCFQVFYLNPENQNGQISRQVKYNALRPVVSNIIYDKKAMSEMTIIKLSDCVSYVDGGKKDIILLCEKVAKEDIEVRFFEEDDAGNRVWEEKADFQPTQVHKQHAIWFRAPRYRNIEITEPVKAFIQLYRPSDHATSEALPFQFLPLDSVVNGNSIKRKRSAFEEPLSKIRGSLDGQESMLHQIIHTTQQYLEPIKTEPRDTVSPLSHGGISPYGGGILYQAGNSPYLVASPSVSPNYYPSPSPESMTYTFRQDTMNVANFDASQQAKEDPNWNIPFPPPNQVQEYSFNVPTGIAAQLPPEPQILDLDKHQVNSADLQREISHIPNIQLADLSLTDFEMNSNPHNTSDSLTNIVNEAASKNFGC
ncbi:embryonic polarity protein dorsal-like isoform X2 [Anthonomus grandis grandis]|nr:embryonic polarity protein dorsal-like isoform X2 [Anthonomus grandis grandis]XP_050303071.1 embryonic polarity protein dorsal-like isoform X2 [Anthonomus grandis grandis]